MITKNKHNDVAEGDARKTAPQVFGLDILLQYLCEEILNIYIPSFRLHRRLVDTQHCSLVGDQKEKQVCYISYGLCIDWYIYNQKMLFEDNCSQKRI